VEKYGNEKGGQGQASGEGTGRESQREEGKGMERTRRMYL